MRLEKRQHILLVKERGSLSPPKHIVVEAFTASDAKEYAQARYPDTNILVLESH